LSILASVDWPSLAKGALGLKIFERLC